MMVWRTVRRLVIVLRLKQVLWYLRLLYEQNTRQPCVQLVQSSPARLAAEPEKEKVST